PDGPLRCSKIDETEVRQRITELGFTQESESAANDNVPVDDATLALLEQSLNAAFKQNGAAPPQIVGNQGVCADGTGAAPTSFCPQDNTIAVGEDSLDKLAALPPDDEPGPAPTTTPPATAAPTSAGLGD